MNAIRRLRWWHAVAFYTALLLILTAISHAVRSPSGHPGAVAGPAAITSPRRTSAPPPRRPSTRTHSSSTSSAPRPHQRVTRRKDHPRPAQSYRYAMSGIALPNARLTPGAINPAVTPATIGSTICVPGYTATIRPGSSYSTSLKVRQLDSGYNYYGDTSTGDYEEDHLISLELGGSPSSPRNLWPEPYAGVEGARAKDRIENKLHELVCSGQLGLRAAQRAIARNWWRADNAYIGVAVASPAPTHTYRPPPPAHTYSPPTQLCTTTSSGSCIHGGEFCPQADYGQTGYDANGTAYTCTGDSEHPHWE